MEFFKWLKIATAVKEAFLWEESCTAKSPMLSWNSSESTPMGLLDEFL